MDLSPHLREQLAAMDREQGRLLAEREVFVNRKARRIKDAVARRKPRKSR